MTKIRPSYVRVRRRAEEALKISDGVPVSVHNIAANYGAEIREFELEPDVSGVLYREKDRSVIVVNGAHSIVRKRFTIAHELGHLLLHEGEEVHVDEGFRLNLRDPRAASAQDVEEIEANAFAANLLMPAEYLRTDIENHALDLSDENALSALAEKYGVSIQALAIRIASLLKG